MSVGIITNVLPEIIIEKRDFIAYCFHIMERYQAVPLFHLGKVDGGNTLVKLHEKSEHFLSSGCNTKI